MSLNKKTSVSGNKDWRKIKYRKVLALLWLASIVTIGFSPSCLNQKTLPTATVTNPSVADTKNIPATNSVSNQTAQTVAVPSAYTENCAKCHGAKGEGKDKSPELIAVTTRQDDAYTEEDLLGIINNPNAYGLSKKMPSFKDKLTEDQKQEIVSWLKTL